MKQSNLIGKTVFILGNNFEEPIKTGVVIDFAPYNIPIVEVEDKEFATCAMLIPYSDRLYHMMREVPKKELWEIFKEVKLFWHELDETMKGKQ